MSGVLVLCMGVMSIISNWDIDYVYGHGYPVIIEKDIQTNRDITHVLRHIIKNFPPLPPHNLANVVYYESLKRDLQTKTMYGFRYDERLKTKVEESTHVSCTLL